MLNYFFLLLVMIASAGQAYAVDSNLGSSAWLGISAISFDYEEFDDEDASFDREDGWLPSLTTGLNLQYQHTFVEVGLSWSAGDVDYASPAQESKTDEEILDLDLLLGVWLLRQGRSSLGLNLGAGYRQWYRDIHSTPTATGLNETYRWAYGFLGLRGIRHLSPTSRIVADFQLSRTVNPQIEVDFDGDFDPISLDLGAENGLRASLAIHWDFKPSTSLWISPWYEYWKLGRSDLEPLLRDGIPVGMVFEPRSETHNAGITAGVTWHFDKR